MSLPKWLFATLFIVSIQQTIAQHNYNGYNLLGIQGAISFFNINTSDLATQQGVGFGVGFTTRGAFRNDFDLIYGLHFQNDKIAVHASELAGLNTQYIEYTIQSANLSLLGSYNLINKHLSIEFGPILRFNGKMALNNSKFEDYIIRDYHTLTAKEIEEIAKFNALIAVGITSGIEHFRLSAQYQYGVTNMLKPLNGKVENSSFNGNSATLILSGTVYF
ncbi:MAG: hypothetical protein CL526_11095 [Aequorivita sp.]|nr:hypothetical protein [Aequorivita sp.]|tara:strand:- start:86914 stop:87570 length:657 start_codon:yes stop_codon:yes gene_type:complete